MKPRHLLLGAALALAAGLAAFGDRSAQTGVAEAVTRAGQPQRQGLVRAAAPREQEQEQGGGPAILRLVPREALVGDSADQFQADANNPFATRDWTPAPAAAPPASRRPPPSAPPLPFTYIGKSVGDGAWEVYLARGDLTYLVRERSVLDGAWRVDRIAPPTLTLTYLPLNQVLQLNIGGFD
jgi:hypothetical protein